MGDDRRWMYDGWNINQAHSDEWIAKSNDFINRAFSLSTINKIRCPCSKCQNAKLLDKVTVSKHLCRNGFVPYYETYFLLLSCTFSRLLSVAVAAYLLFIC